MTTAEIREKILNDDLFISEEIQKILTYYQLKHTLRWAQDSSQTDDKESVAEHVYGMSILSNYFLPLQEPKLDPTLVNDLILWHDMAEALVDDMMTLDKTESHKQLEKEAESKLVKESPKHLSVRLEEIFKLYNSQKTPEANFVKAIDKLEPLFQILFISNKLDFEENKEKHALTADIMDKYQAERLRYIEKYPEIVCFCELLNKKIKQSKFIHPAAW